MTAARLLFKTHRFEALAVLAAAALLAVAALYVTSRLNGVAVETGCVQQWFSSGPVEASEACSASMQEFGTINEGEAGKVMAGMALLPFIGGLLIGVPLVGREIEQRTATLAWSLQSSRRRWLLKRVAIGGLALAAALAVPAATAEILEPARQPWLDPSTTAFRDYGLRGPLTVFRGLAAFAIGLLAGAVIGRVLPALIIGTVGAVLLVQVVLAAQWAYLPPAEMLPVSETEGAGRAGLQMGSGDEPEFRDRAGNVVTWQEIVARAPYPEYDEELGDADPRFYAWFESEFERYEPFIPGEKLGFVAVREAMGLSIFSVVLVGISAIIVSRRRPY